jgi:cyclophilin family peptidyl-prolyl cis-trans isomerase
MRVGMNVRMQKGDGSGGECVFKPGRGALPNGCLPDETYMLRHTGRGVLSMASHRGIDTAGSCFNLTLGPTPLLDERAVVFGFVLQGRELLDDIEAAGSSEGWPVKPVVVSGCGQVEGDGSAQPGKSKHSMAALLAIASFTEGKEQGRRGGGREPTPTLQLRQGKGQETQRRLSTPKPVGVAASLSRDALAATAKPDLEPVSEEVPLATGAALSLAASSKGEEAPLDAEEEGRKREFYFTTSEQSWPSNLGPRKPPAAERVRVKDLKPPPRWNIKSETGQAAEVVSE